MEIKLTPAVISCLKRGLNCWFQQNYADGLEIKEILKQAEEIKLSKAMEQEPIAWLVTYGGLSHVEYTQPTQVVDTHYQPLYAAQL